MSDPMPFESSPEVTNGFKLTRLLINGGTAALRNVFDGKIKPVNLKTTLSSDPTYSTLVKLYNDRFLTQPQWEKLFPPDSTNPDSKTFDISLLFLLLTNLCGLTKPKKGWDEEPNPKNKSLEGDITRIKFYRNEFYAHTVDIGVSDSKFKSYWSKISSALVGLGMKKGDIDRLKNEKCGKEEVDRIRKEWKESEIEWKLELKRIQAGQNNVNILVNEGMLNIQQVVSQGQEEARSTLQGMQQTQYEAQERGKEEYRSLRESVQQMIKQNEREVLTELLVCDFKPELEKHCESYLDGTRLWIIEEVENWFNDSTSEHRALVITGAAGMGKSVVAAVICRKWKKTEQLAGFHFCEHNNARYNDPNFMLQSLASQMCDVLPQYKEALVKQLSRNVGQELNSMDIAQLFSLLFKEPFSDLEDPGRNFLLVIDGVDESEYKKRNEVVDVIANHLHKLPGWIRLLVTTRPERNLTDKLQKLKQSHLYSDDKRNLKDIQLFFEKKLTGSMEQKNKNAMVSRLAGRSEGLMLYAFFLAEQIKENLSTIDMDNLDTLPQGISRYYSKYFKRLEDELRKNFEIKVDNFLNFLSSIAVARQPLPLEMVTRILSPSECSSLSVERIVRKAISSISSLLPIDDDHLNFFHKSVKDWLLDNSDDDFSCINENAGHKILSELCAKEFDGVKESGVTRSSQVSNSLKYALQHGVQHMLEVDEESESVEKYATNLELMYGKLCVDSVAGVKEILLIQEHKAYNMLSEITKETLNTLWFLLRKYGSMLGDYPHSFFQHVLNEGGKELSSKASHLLNIRYRNIPYLEFVDKETVPRSIECCYYSSGEVVSFDVSPEQDYMVCRCQDGTIELFSLKTGKKEWTQKGSFPSWDNFDIFYNLSFYRSVVFHPIENVILPGRLDRVYNTITGLCEVGPFSCEGKCTFSFISFSQDKTRILTICPDNNKQVVVWNVKSGEMIKCIDCPCHVVSCAFSSNGKLIATTDSNKMFRVYNVENDCSIKLVAESELSSSSVIIASVCDSDSWLSTTTGDFCSSILKMDLENLKWVENLHVDNCRCLPSVSNAVFDNFEKVCSLSEYLPNMRFFCLLDGERALVVSTAGLNVSQVKEIKNDVNQDVGNFTTTISLDGSIVYQFKEDSETIISELSVVRCQKNEYRNITISEGVLSLVPVKDGVLLLPINQIPELWNLDVSRRGECFRELGEIKRLLSISEDLVGCVGEIKVDILNISSGEIMSTTTISNDGKVLACSCKFEVLIYNWFNKKTSLWKVDCMIREIVLDLYTEGAIFSPQGDQLVIWGGFPLRIVEPSTGNDLQDLPFFKGGENIVYACSFVSGGKFLICSCTNNLLFLVNVRLGEVLTYLDVGRFPHPLSTCLKKPLFTVGLDHTKDFKLIKIWLPGEREVAVMTHMSSLESVAF